MPRKRARQRALQMFLLFLVALCWASPLKAQEAWLVTYGPGAEVWELFGHNALWLRDPDSGLDHTYSFGYFELDRPGFHLDFARGIMLYFGASSLAEREFAFYRSRQRSIMVQRLNLSADQVRDLHLRLHEAIYPHPQYYAYDYFRNNCSTWLRDMIDQVLGGQLAPRLNSQPARLNFRDHTRRMTYARPWIHTGIMLLMGQSIDQPISAWEESFLPDALARWLDDIVIDDEPLVLETRVLYDPQVFQPPEDARGPRTLMLGAGLLGAALILLPGLGARSRWSRLTWHVGVLLAGLAGLVLALMWLGTGHRDTWHNWMLLVLNPAWWLLWRTWAAPWRMVVMTGLLAALGLGTLILAVPGLIQDRPDQLALVLPPLLAILTLAWRDGRGFNPKRA